MKRVIINGITCLEPLPGSGQWYWGTDDTDGVQWEAEERFLNRYSIRQNRFLVGGDVDGRKY